MFKVLNVFLLYRWAAISKVFNFFFTFGHHHVFSIYSLLFFTRGLGWWGVLNLPSHQPLFLFNGGST